MAEKKRKLTEREKRCRREAKKKLQEAGVLPPDKKRLNRKKFVEETLAEWRTRRYSEIWDIHLSEAAMIMSAKTDEKYRTSLEAVGAAKVLKIAMLSKEFEEKMREQGRKEYNYQEKMDYLMEIFKA